MQDENQALLTMNGQRRIVRHQQYAALYLEAQLEADKQKYFLGSAKVDIDLLSFDPFLTRDIHPPNSERLLSSYELVGCSQLDPNNHIPATIDERDFLQALLKVRSTEAAARSRDHQEWPMLSFPPGTRIEGLRGKHRIDAANVYLQPGVRWWVVDFYSKSLSVPLRNSLMAQTSNEQPLSPGEIYFHVLRCDPDDDRATNSWWAQIQSLPERAELRRLYSRTRLNTPFRKLSKMPASGRGMLAGSIGSILRLKCDEEVIQYLNHVHDTWGMLVGTSEHDLHKVDSRTVDELEARVPALSKSDEIYLKPRIEDGSLFRHFTKAQRDSIWRRLLLYPHRVPSLRLFFKDVIYLESLAYCLKALINPVRRQSVYEAFSAAFSLAEVRQSDTHPTSIRMCSFGKSYRCLFLAAMRQIETLRPGSVMLERFEKRTATQADTRAWRDFAQEAFVLGFRSEKIENLRSRQPDRVAAYAFLRQIRDPEHFEYEESDFDSLVDQVVAALEQVPKKATAREQPSLTTTEHGQGRSRRAGRPFSGAYNHGAKFLTYDHVYSEEPTSQDEPTAFFVQRDIFLAFFGFGSDPTSSSQNDSPTLAPDITGLGPNPSESLPSLSAVASDCHESDQQSPLLIEHGYDRSIARRSYSSISSSHYSQASEEDEVGSPASPMRTIRAKSPKLFEHDPEELEENADQDVRFCSLAGSRPQIVEEIVISGANDPRVETLAGRYASQGMFLYNRRMRSLCPGDVIEEALLDRDRSVFLIPQDRDVVAAEATLYPGSKRPGEDLASNRPRKIHLLP